MKETSEAEDLNPSTAGPLFIVDGLEDRCGNAPQKLVRADGYAPPPPVCKTGKLDTPLGIAPSTDRFADGSVH